MHHAQNFDVAFTNAIRNYIRQAGDHQFAGTEKPARPTGGEMCDKHGLGARHQFKDNATGGRGTILADVFGDIVEIIPLVSTPGKCEADRKGSARDAKYRSWPEPTREAP